MALESNEINPDDVTSMKMVLNAASQIKAEQFSVIINKVSAEVLEALESRKEALTASLFPPPMVRTSSIFYAPLNPDWVGKKKRWGHLSLDLGTFISNSPLINVVPQKQSGGTLNRVKDKFRMTSKV